MVQHAAEDQGMAKRVCSWPRARTQCRLAKHSSCPLISCALGAAAPSHSPAATAGTLLRLDTGSWRPASCLTVQVNGPHAPTNLLCLGTAVPLGPPPHQHMPPWSAAGCNTATG
jgi:hypothetical protein